MRWLYITCGSAGGVLAVAFVSYRMYAYFHRYAVATSRDDIQMNALVFLGVGAGIVMVPVGVALGLLVGAAINRGLNHLQLRRRQRLAGSADDLGASWVTRQPKP